MDHCSRGGGDSGGLLGASRFPALAGKTAWAETRGGICGLSPWEPRLVGTGSSPVRISASEFHARRRLWYWPTGTSRLVCRCRAGFLPQPWKHPPPRPPSSSSSSRAIVHVDLAVPLGLGTTAVSTASITSGRALSGAWGVGMACEASSLASRQRSRSRLPPPPRRYGPLRRSLPGSDWRRRGFDERRR